MNELLLTPQMATDARTFDAWHRQMEAGLIVRKVRRPAHRAAGLLGHSRKRGVGA